MAIADVLVLGDEVLRQIHERLEAHFGEGGVVLDLGLVAEVFVAGGVGFGLGFGHCDGGYAWMTRAVGEETQGRGGSRMEGSRVGLVSSRWRGRLVCKRADVLSNSALSVMVCECGCEREDC